MLHNITKKIMEVEKRQELAKFLRWGDKRIIAQLACVSRLTIDRWITGETVDSTVEPYIVSFLEKRKKEVELRMESFVSKTMP